MTTNDLSQRIERRRTQLVDDQLGGRISRMAALDDFEQLIRWQDRRAIADAIRATHPDLADQLDDTTVRRPAWA